MNISSKPLSIHSGEKLYRQQNPVIQRQTAVQPPHEAEEKNSRVKIPGRAVPAEKVLSSREVDTLNALFNNGNHINQGLYGRSKVQNIHSGYLLDVKG